jgi:effector-binding domain-containing protein
MAEINIVELEPQIVIGMRKKGAYKDIANLIPKLFEFAASKNIQPIGPPTFVCHEMSGEEANKANKEQNADIEVVVPVASKSDDNEEVKCYELSGGKMAKIIHKGPYDSVGPTYEKLFTWLNENNMKVVGPTREIYLSDPMEVPPEEILTEIYAPVA